MSEGPWLAVGLGNPGDRYARTRHNVGQMAVAQVAYANGSRFKADRKVRCDVADVRLGGRRLILAVPHSFMNESGGPVSAVTQYYGIDPEHLIVVHDEIDLPFEALRVKFGGGDNGHNGLRSVRKSLGHGEFYRVRCGVGRPMGRQDPADYLLSDFRAGERPEVAVMVAEAADATEYLMRDGLEATQSRFNR